MEKVRGEGAGDMGNGGRRSKGSGPSGITPEVMFAIHFSINTGGGDTDVSVLSPGDLPSDICKAITRELSERGMLAPGESVLEHQAFEEGRSSVKIGAPGSGEWECNVAYVSVEPVLVAGGRVFSLVERIL